MIREHLPGVMYHQAYKYTKIIKLTERTSIEPSGQNRKDVEALANLQRSARCLPRERQRKSWIEKERESERWG